MSLWDGAGDVFSHLWDKTQDQAIQTIDARFGGSGDHVPAQNAAVSEMAALLQRFNQTKPHSTADYQLFESQILGAAAAFTSYAQTFRNARADRGASEVTALARQIVLDAESDRQATPGWIPPGISNVLSGLPSWAVPVGLVGAALFLGRRR